MREAQQNQLLTREDLQSSRAGRMMDVLVVRVIVWEAAVAERHLCRSVFARFFSGSFPECSAAHPGEEGALWRREERKISTRV